MILGRKVEVIVTGPRGEVECWAKIDTGSYSSSIDESIATSIGLRKTGTRALKTALGQDYRETGVCTFIVGDSAIESEVSVSERSELKCPVLIGRKDLKQLGALVDITKTGVE